MSHFLKSRETLQISILILLSAAIFGNTLDNDFIWDDPFLITANPYIRDGKNIPLFFTPRYWNELHPFQGHYRPLRTVSLAVNYSFGKLDPVGFRLTNILLHSVNVILVFYLVAIIVVRRDEGQGGRIVDRRLFISLPFLTALFFAVHPVHTESINLVKNRSDLFALLFFLLSFHLFVRNVHKGGRLSILGAWFCFIPAVLSKEMALTLPGVLVLYAACFLSGRQRQKALIRIIPYAAIIAGYFWFLHSFISPSEPWPGGFPLPETAGQQTLVVIQSIGFYLKMLTVPFPLNVEHAFAIPVSVLDPSVMGSLTVLLLIGAVAVRSRQRSPIVLFALGWMLLTLLPASNIVFLVSRPLAEQRLYIPSGGFCLLLACGIERLSTIRPDRLKPERARITAGLMVMIVVSLYAAITVHRNFDWQDEMTFYSRTAALNPNSARIQNNLGLALRNAEKYADAITHFQAALRLQPDYAKAHFNLGFTYFKTNRYEEAISQYRTGLEFLPDRADPDYVGIYNNMGAALMKQGDIDGAVAVFRKAIEIKPDFPDACYNLGTALKMTQNYREALVLFSKVLEINPDDIDARQEYEFCLAKLTVKRTDFVSP